MQSYPLKFAPGSAQRTYSTAANLFVYESGKTTPDGGETRIKVKPDNGAEIVLRPGQAFRLSDGIAANWYVSAFDPAQTLDGTIIIGSGEWYDANTLNTFKLDASFANNVSVNNTPANAVPVKLSDADVGTIAGGNIMAYTGQYFANSGQRAAGVQALVTPAQNTNGILLLKYYLSGQATAAVGSMTILAKSSMPATITDGDVLDMFTVGTVSATTLKSDVAQGIFKIPPGKGLYLANNQNQNVYFESVFWQVL